jgi:eukaryotic-like serine/threonine-protein kinase
VLLFVDQFEELYTLVPDAAERHAFTTALAAVADDSAAPLRVVVSMRSDFLDRVGEDARFLEELSRGLVFLSAPDREGLREALDEPLAMVGYKFETSEMVEDMLYALEGTPGALPLLQFAAARLWELRDRERKLLTAESYLEIGGITGALATHADEVVRNMNANAQRLTQKIFRQLVTPERTRAIVELTDIYALADDRPEISRVLDLLVAARLLVVQKRDATGSGSVEIVHESMTTSWPALRRWLDEDQEDSAYRAEIAAAAKQWDVKGRAAGLLWRGEALEEARRWYTARPRALAGRDQAFIDAVLAHGRRIKRRRSVLLASSFSLLTLVAIGASIAYVRVRAAEQSAVDEAKRANVNLAKYEAEERARRSAEGDAAAAEERKRKAEQAAREKSVDLALSKEELIKKNAELDGKNAELVGLVADAKAARDKAEAASRKAEAAAAEEKRLKAELQAKLDEEKARVKKLQDEMKKISTQLKE